MRKFKDAFSSFKGYLGGIFKVLALLKSKEKHISKASQSIRTNYFFTFWGVILTIVVIMTLLGIKAATNDQSITGGGVAVVALICFGINFWKLYRCESYHNRRPGPPSLFLPSL
jgi:quinol-cytochrome oxidoreductase complex cytochrome b subunit